MGAVSFLAAFGLALGVVVLVELPDKTLVATLVLSTRYRPWPVLAGVAAAFAVQCVVACVAGGLLHLLPHRLLEVAAAVLFLGGAALLFWSAPAGADQNDDELGVETQERSTARIALTCFGVLFLAEWGDASQLATAALVARTNDAWAIGLGAWAALSGVAAVAVAAGKYVADWIPLRLIQLAAGAVFTAFAIMALIAAARA